MPSFWEGMIGVRISPSGCRDEPCVGRCSVSNRQRSLLGSALIVALAATFIATSEALIAPVLPGSFCGMSADPYRADLGRFGDMMKRRSPRASATTMQERKSKGARFKEYMGRKSRVFKEYIDTVKGGGGIQERMENVEEKDKVGGSSSSSSSNGVPQGAPKGQRRRAQSKTFVLTDLRTDDNLSVSSSGQQLRTARGNWIENILSTGTSRVLARVSQRLGFIAIWSAYLVLVFNVAPKEWEIPDLFMVPGWPHELVGGFLAILLVFRTDQAYQRFWEGRAKWASAAGQCKSLARMAVSNLDEEYRDLVLSHVCAFPVTLKQHLRGERNVKEIERIFTSFEDAETGSSLATSIAGGNSMPLMCLTSLSMSIKRLDGERTKQQQRLEQDDIEGAGREYEGSVELMMRMEDLITQLSTVVAECEQIKCTPIPLSYSRHTSRFFTLFAVTMPFALIPSTNPVLVPLITTAISWILFATEEIGCVIEEPFGQGLDDERDFPAFDEALVEEVFFFFDQDNSGSIDKTEFYLALQKLGINTRAEDIDRLVEEIDTNNNQLIELDEFQVLLRRAMKDKSAVSRPMPNSISETLGFALVQSIEGFYMVVSMVFGYENMVQGQTDGSATRQLEVLPLGLYCDQIQREVLQQAVFAVDRPEEQERYIEILLTVGRVREAGKKVLEILT